MGEWSRHVLAFGDRDRLVVCGTGGILGTRVPSASLTGLLFDTERVEGFGLVPEAEVEA